MDSVDHFTTTRLTAERLRETHLDDIRRIDQDPRIMKTIGGLRSEEESREYLQRNLDHWNEHGHGLWMLRLRADGAFVGRAALRHRHLGYDDLVAGTLPDHWASRNVMEKVGGRYERDATYKGAPHVLYRFEQSKRGGRNLE